MDRNITLYKNGIVLWDEYVKFSTYNEIMLLLAREIQREFNQDYNYPKRFQHSCGQRDW